MPSRASAALRLANSSRMRRGGSSIVAGRQRLSRRDLEVAAQVFSLDPPPIMGTPPATEDAALGLPPFGRAVALIANAMAATDWYARRRDPDQGIYVRLDEQPNILTDPYPLQTVWSYRWAAGEDGILYGNHFALKGELDWRTGRPGWIVPIPAEDVWLVTDAARPLWYAWNIGGSEFDADEIFHIPFGARSGEVLGRGVLAQYADWLGGVIAAEDYSRDTFAAGALPPAVITTNQASTPAQADDLKRKWREVVSTREPVIMPNGTVLTPVVGNAEQAQLVAARTWNAQMVANAVGVPGWKLGLDGPTMTYQNVETGDIDFVRDSVDRYGRPVTEAISKWLLPSGWEATWDYTSRMRADTKTAAEVDRILIRTGIKTIPEVRAERNLPPLRIVGSAQAVGAENIKAAAQAVAQNPDVTINGAETAEQIQGAEALADRIEDRA